MPWCGEQTLRLKLRAVLCAEGSGNAGPVPDTEILIHLGNLRAQLVGVALTQTTYDEEVVDAPRLLGRHVADEAAGVDDDGAGVGAVAVEAHLIPCGGQLRHQMFAVDGILRTAESYDVYLFHLFFSGKLLCGQPVRTLCI